MAEVKQLEFKFPNESRGAHPSVITREAHRRLVKQLEKYGNKPSKQHRDELLEVHRLMTEMAYGVSYGRFAIPLEPGTGKTLSIVAWVSTMMEIGNPDTSILICASQVEALCRLKRQFVEAGVSEDDIGLHYSIEYDQVLARQYLDGAIDLPRGYASEPKTEREDCDSKRILLVTHNRIRGKADVETYNSFNGDPRSFVVWDESMFKSDCSSFEIRRLEQVYDWLKHEDGKVIPEVIDYLGQCISLAKGELGLQGGPSILRFPYLEKEKLDQMIVGLPERESAKIAKAFLAVCQQDMRVVKLGSDKGIITYEQVVDQSLDNIIILDASHPIRELTQLDKTIRVVGDGAGISYEDVVVHELNSGSGRCTLEKDLFQDKDSLLLKEVLEVVGDIPDDEALLIFTFNQRGDQDYVKCIRDSLRRSGVDVDAVVDVQEADGRFVKLKRINFLTWGNETSLSAYSHCSHVILAGVLHRARTDIASYAAGQQDDLLVDIDTKGASSLISSEKAHCIYQAICRGACRIIQDNKARPMTVWLINKDRKVKAYLQQVMPGSSWKEWEPQYLLPKTKESEVGRIIADYLNSLPSDQERISSLELKKRTGLTGTVIARNTYTRAARRYVPKAGWRCDGKSYVRDNAESYGFTSC